MWVNTFCSDLNSYTMLRFSRHIKCGLRSEWCQIQDWRTEAKILVTANDLHTNQNQKTWLSHRQFLLCAMSKALWQDTHITFQMNLKYLAQWKSLIGKSLFPAFSEIKEAETQSQLHVCCTLEQKDKPSRQSSPCATQFNGSSVSVMCLQTKYHPLLTSASLPLPPAPQERELVA